jgi:hypothetical protein
MPPITRLFVKTALVYFVAALIVGIAVTLPALRSSLPFLGGLTPVYFHLFMVGWVTQLIAGVAYWMFPKFTRTQPRGSDRLAWATYLLLNAGLLLRVVAEPALGVSALPLWGWLVALAAVLQWAGGMAFVANTWPRVKEK